MLLAHEDFTLQDQGAFISADFLCTIDMDKLLVLKPLVEASLTHINKPLVIDLAAVTFLDSAAVGLLAILFKHTQRQNLGIALCCAQPQAEAVLSMVGLTDFAPHFAQRDEAEKYLGGLK